MCEDKKRIFFSKANICYQSKLTRIFLIWENKIFGRDYISYNNESINSSQFFKDDYQKISGKFFVLPGAGWSFGISLITQPIGVCLWTAYGGGGEGCCIITGAATIGVVCER